LTQKNQKNQGWSGFLTKKVLAPLKRFLTLRSFFFFTSNPQRRCVTL